MNMNITKELTNHKKQLEASTLKLKQLREELPSYRNLLEEATTKETALKRDRASLDELTTQKLRVLSAQELHEQQEADIITEAQRIQTLTLEIKTLETLTSIAETEKALNTLQTSYCADFTRILETLYSSLEELAEKRRNWFEMRADFRADFKALAGVEWREHYNTDNKKTLEEGIAILEEHGVNPMVFKLIPDYSSGHDGLDRYPIMNYPSGLEKVAEVFQFPRDATDLPIILQTAKFIFEYVMYRKGN
jgi:DNA repair exonuclease SbcCD ATPase subunit